MLNFWFTYIVLQHIPNLIYIYDLVDEFIIIILQAYHNFEITNEFNIILVDIYHKFHMHCIVSDSKYVLLEKYDKFHLYDKKTS
jgi:hypothetical protein